MGVAISTPAWSGRAMARLLLDSNLAEQSGAYFQIEKKSQSSKASIDRQAQQELREESIVLTGTSVG